MARIPDADALGGRPTPQYRKSIATVRNAGAVADAVGDFGGQVAQVGEQMLQREDKLNYAAAKTALLKADVTARQELAEDPDYTTYETRYLDKMGKAKEQTGKLIRSKYDRRLFEVDTSMDLERGRAEVAGLALTKRRGVRLATATNGVEDLRAAYRAANDDPTRETIIKTGHDTIQSLIEGGDIDPVKGTQWQRDLASQFTYENIATKIDKGDIGGAKEAMNRFGRYLDSDEYLKLNSALNDEHDAQQVMKAADVGMGKPIVEAPKDVPSLVKQLFPNAHITDSGVRQGALRNANPGSYHNIGQGMDVRAIPGVTFEEFVDGLKAAGLPVVEAIDEYKNPSKHATGGHWHVAWTNRKAVPAATVDDAVSRGIAALGANATVKQIEQTRQEITQRWSLKESSERDAEESAVENAQGLLVKNGGNWYALPASVRRSVNPKYVPGLINFGEGLAPSAPKRVTDPATYVNLTAEAATNPKAFAARNPITYRSALDDTDWERLVATRNTILGKADEGGGNDAGSVTAVRSVASPLLAARGITLTGIKAGSDKYKEMAGRIYQFDKTVQGDLAIWRQNNPGKKPDAEVVQKIADRRLAETIVTEKGWIWDSDKTIAQYEAGGKGQLQIPDTERTRIIREMTPILGRQPTPAEVADTWIREARGG